MTHINNTDHIDCEQVEELISDYLENELSRDIRAQIAMHLETCSSCARLKEKLEEMIGVLPELEEEVPFFLKNRLLYIPESQEDKIIEMTDRRAFLKWFAAAITGIALLLNIFYFTNIIPAANRTMHGLVSNIQTFAVKTGALYERVKESKNIIFQSELDPEIMTDEQTKEPMGKDQDKKENGGKNG